MHMQAALSGSTHASHALSYDNVAHFAAATAAAAASLCICFGHTQTEHTHIAHPNGQMAWPTGLCFMRSSCRRQPRRVPTRVADALTTPPRLPATGNGSLPLHFLPPNLSPLSAFLQCRASTLLTEQRSRSFVIVAAKGRPGQQGLPSRRTYSNTYIDAPLPPFSPYLSLPLSMAACISFMTFDFGQLGS